MPQGLQCFDAYGRIVLDTNDRLTRILGEFETGGAPSGSYYDANLYSGTPWLYLTCAADTTAPWQTIYIYVSGATISWSPETYHRGNWMFNFRIMYGVW